ncbi:MULTISPECIES: hypothetical protein [unclassified Novosphingobium]|uniref:hypothetical protein n=1 Tax=unclassified Novosphingobium TaxID=2644732 RepID=UPI00146CF6A5|nr:MULTISPECIES: hypothetical protein [unclassified Novosphingobium]NMN04856.1 hypothetical protein [Novosphingobium sp. SG919]NMN85150.1 hypothetical protein [Novosphingobium sp. SG916]
MNDHHNPFQHDVEIDMFTGEVRHRNNGGGAIILLLVLAPIIMASTVFLAVIFPVAGCGALVVGYLVQSIAGYFAQWPTDDPLGGWTTDDLARLTVMILASMVALFCLLPVEGWVSRRFARYVQLRHWIRVFGLALMLNEIGVDYYFSLIGQPWNAGGHGLLAGVTADKLQRIAVFAVGIHVIFRLIDTRGTNSNLLQRLGLPGRRARIARKETRR